MRRLKIVIFSFFFLCQVPHEELSEEIDVEAGHVNKDERDDKL